MYSSESKTIQKDSQKMLGEKSTNLVSVVFVTESAIFSMSMKHEKCLIQT